MGYGAETINPFYSSVEKDNPIAQEMFRLGISARLPSDIIDKIRLTPEQHAEYIKFSANPGGGAKSLKEALNELIASEGYQTLPEGDESTQGTKQKLIKDIIAKYRAVGRGKILASFSAQSLQ